MLPNEMVIVLRRIEEPAKYEIVSSSDEVYSLYDCCKMFCVTMKGTVGMT